MSLNFDDTEIEKVRESLSDPDIEISRESKKLLKASDTFIEIYEEKRKRSRALLLKYINQSGIDYNELFVVDVGWKGTVQDNLFRLLNTEINGFYLGLRQVTTADIRNQKKGLLLNYIPTRSKYIRQFGFNSVFLRIFSMQIILAP